MRQRRGTAPFELSLVLPAVFILLAAFANYGWYAHVHDLVADAAAQGAHAAADADADEDPVAAAETAVRNAWRATGLGNAPEIRVMLTGDDTVEVAVQRRFEGIMAWSPLPTEIVLTAVRPLEG